MGKKTQPNGFIASVKVNTINGCTGDVEISEMWKRHFGALYNSISDKGEKDTFLSAFIRDKPGQKHICDKCTGCSFTLL